MTALDDRRRILAATFLRALATGLVGVLLGLHLARLEVAPARAGAIVSAGLAGAALAALAATLAADRRGRRRLLVELTLLAGTGGLALALVERPLLLAGVCLLGMVNGMGRDRGAHLVLEQAILPATTTDRARTRAFAWYNVLQDAGHAAGGLLAAVPGLLERAGAPAAPAYRGAFLLYALLLLLCVPLYLGLGPAVETARKARAPLSPATRRILARLCALFALDSLGGGFLTTALLSFVFAARFGASELQVGLLFFAARVANALSHLAAARLAARFGLVNTMVFTHVPSSLLLVTVAWAPSLGVAALLFLLRESLVEMDVPTRQSYVMAVVAPEERTVASGATHLVRLGAWAVAPALAGPLMEGVSLTSPLVAGAAMKIAYDLLLYRAFRGLRPPEERPGGGEGGGREAPRDASGEAREARS